MRKKLFAALPAGLAVLVWWQPLSKPLQSFWLLLSALLFLVLVSRGQRLDRARKAVLEAKAVLRQAREGNRAAQADITAKLDDLTRLVNREEVP